MAIERTTPTKNGKENAVAISNQQPKSSDNRDDDGNVDMKDSKSPFDLYFDQQKAWLKQHKEVLGPRMIKGIDGDDESEDDEEEDKSKYTTEQMNSLRYIMVTKNLEKQFHAMQKLVLGDQADEELMMFDTSFSMDVLHSWHHLKRRAFPKHKQPAQKLDLLIAYTSNLQEYDVWMHDNEGGMEVLVKGLAAAWKQLLQNNTDEQLGWDIEYTKPGVLELLEQFKTDVEVYNGEFNYQ